jgi:hypothetical protein
MVLLPAPCVETDGNLAALETISPALTRNVWCHPQGFLES